MGCFSWITQNTSRSIMMSGYGSRRHPSRTCYLWDNKGRRWREPEYKGYGIFGGKDYYILLAEMNKEYGPNVTDEDKRMDGIDIDFSDKTGFLYPNLTDCKEWIWINIQATRCPNQGAVNCNIYGYDDDSSEEEEEEEEEEKYNDCFSVYDRKKKHTVIDKFDGWMNGETRPVKNKKD